jgi:AraC family transcriptional regulator
MIDEDYQCKLARGRFNGSCIHRSETDSLTLTEYTYPANLTIGKHSHELAYFSVLLDGNYTENFDSKIRICKPLTVTFHPSGEGHQDSFHNCESRIFSIEFDSSRLQSIPNVSRALNEPAEFHGGLPASLLIRAQREAVLRDELSSLVIDGLFLELVAHAARFNLGKLQRKPPHWLEMSMEMIHEQFHERLRLNDVAEMVGVHPVHLAREFRKHYHYTVGEYVRQRRVEFACRKLMTSDDSLASIAFSAGFSHQSHFSKTFKLQIGMTPRQYRMLPRKRKSSN